MHTFALLLFIILFCIVIIHNFFEEVKLVYLNWYKKIKLDNPKLILPNQLKRILFINFYEEIHSYMYSLPEIFWNQRKSQRKKQGIRVLCTLLDRKWALAILGATFTSFLVFFWEHHFYNWFTMDIKSSEIDFRKKKQKIIRNWQYYLRIKTRDKLMTFLISKTKSSN